MEFEIEGIKVFDPRDGEYKVSDNPALIFYDLFIKGKILTSGDPDKLVEFIKLAADYLEAEIE